MFTDFSNIPVRKFTIYITLFDFYLIDRSLFYRRHAIFINSRLSGVQIMYLILFYIHIWFLVYGMLFSSLYSTSRYYYDILFDLFLEVSYSWIASVLLIWRSHWTWLLYYFWSIITVTRAFSDSFIQFLRPYTSIAICVVRFIYMHNKNI